MSPNRIRRAIENYHNKCGLCFFTPNERHTRGFIEFVRITRRCVTCFGGNKKYKPGIAWKNEMRKFYVGEK